MYDSLIPWIVVPFIIHSFVSTSATGTATYEADKNTLCYPYSKVKVVVDNKGKEVVSSSRLYLLGSTTIKGQDMVSFEGAKREIIAIETFYDSGIPSIKVVYLK